MTGLMEQILQLGRLSVEDPRAGARTLLAMSVPLPARTAGLLLMAVASALLMHLGLLVLPLAEDPLTDFMLQSPIRTAAIQWLILAASVLLIHRIGRAWGGRGGLSDTLLVVVWLQVIMLAVQLLQLLLLILAPPLVGIANLGGMVLFFWLLTGFIAELHGFARRWAVLAGIFVASFGVALLIATGIMLVYGPEALQNV